MKLMVLAAGLAGLLTHSSLAAELTVNPVVSAPRPAETPFSAAIAPSSNLPRGFARCVAMQILPMMPGTQVFTVRPTGSMRPAFDDNTILLTEPAPFNHLKIGDIVVFRHTRTNARIVHRIIERRKGGYWTKGDHNIGMDDELVTEANYLGRVFGIFYTSRAGVPPLPEALREGQTMFAQAR